MASIEKAYCYETDAIETAELAVYKRQKGFEDTYFCISDRCGFRVYPKHRKDTGTCWFESEDVTRTHNHVSSCPHFVKQENHGGGTKNPTGPEPLLEPDLIPTFIGGLPNQANRRSWKDGLSREEIASMATKAQPAPIPGIIETVVDAYYRLKQDRSSFPLNVCGHQKNYQTAFVWIKEMEYPWNADQWPRTIVVADCSVKAGKNVWFVNTLATFPVEGQRLKVSLTINVKEIENDSHKRALSKLLESAAVAKSDVKLFWHGQAPLEKNGFWNLISTHNPIHTCFAIRTKG